MLGWLFVFLFAYLIFLIPGVDFLGQVLGGTITNFDTFLSSVLPGGFGVAATFLSPLGEVALFNLYPFSWILTYRPEDYLSVLYMIGPWIIAGLLVGKIKAESGKDAIAIGIGLINWYIIWAVGLFMGLPLLSKLPILGTMGPFIDGAITGLATGLTDIPPGWSAILVALEGGAFFTGSALLTGLTKEGFEGEEKDDIIGGLILMGALIGVALILTFVF